MSRRKRAHRPVKAGDRFGEWTLLGQHVIRGKSAVEKCRCSCGTLRDIKRCVLRTGKSRSCGCKKGEHVSKHGMYSTPTYVCWQQAKKRCENVDDKDYKSYGGRGITFCSRWQEFENFLADMGVKPSGLTLGRVDNNGPYSPENCEWQTLKQQARNKRNTKHLTINGVTKSLADWSDETGVAQGTIRARLRSGWSHAQAAKTPTR